MTNILPYEIGKDYDKTEIYVLAKRYGRDADKDFRDYLQSSGNNSYRHYCYGSKPHTHRSKHINPTLSPDLYGKCYSYGTLRRNFIRGLSDRDPDQDIATGILLSWGNATYQYRGRNSTNSDHNHTSCYCAIL